jgi:hypothetical protein
MTLADRLVPMRSAQPPRPIKLLPFNASVPSATTPGSNICHLRRKLACPGARRNDDFSSTPYTRDGDFEPFTIVDPWYPIA